MSITCVCCNFEDHVEDAEFCQECGTSLDNYCSNNQCVMNNGESVSVPNNAKFCPYCGEGTTYYNAGLFEPIEN